MLDAAATAQIEQIEISMEAAKRAVAKRDLVQKLRKNAAFRELIEQGYFKDEAARLVSALGNPALVESRGEIWKDIEAIPRLEQYFRTIIQLGDVCEREISDAQEALSELREGETE